MSREPAKPQPFLPSEGLVHFCQNMRARLQGHPVPGRSESGRPGPLADGSRRASLAEPGVRAVVIGAGKSGLAAAELLVSKGARVVLADDKLDATTKANAASSGAELVSLSELSFDDVELAVLSPGVPRTRPELLPALRKEILVGEIELASWFVPVPMVGITGTNGKSTTTALVAHLLNAAGRRAFAGGNLGEPLSRWVLDTEASKRSSAASSVSSASLAASAASDHDIVVVELSSYQLESVVLAEFEVACWLNLTPDHTDRYPDLDAYAAAKQRLAERRSATGIAVLNADDDFCVRAGEALAERVRWFSTEPSSKRASEAGTILVGEHEARRTHRDKVETYAITAPGLIGVHNKANACAAIECVRHFGADIGALQQGLASFAGLAHRLEKVGEIDGVSYFNDSKATNIDSAIIGVRGVKGPKILIAGGKDKGSSWSPLVEACRESDVRAVLAIGAAEALVLEAFQGRIAILEACRDLERALFRARRLARPGDSILLSPACASFDQFSNFEHRGEVFRRLVHQLREEAEQASRSTAGGVE